MKIVSCLLLCFLASVSLAGYDDGHIIGPGEYEYGVEIFGNDTLIVDGGGADRIDMWSNSYLEVRDTSMPLGLDVGGVYDISLGDQTSLMFRGGATELIALGKNATATLKGGQINHIMIYGYPNYSPQVTIYCQDGWNWLYTSGQKTGITGLWENGTSFEIDFIDAGNPFPPTANGISIIEVPEPAMLALLGFGGLLIRRKKP